jgi:hypothetical protein
MPDDGISISKSKSSQTAHAVFARLGYFLPHFPALATLTGNAHFSVVFSRLLYHDEYRLRQGAPFFARTDAQLADECGLGLFEFTQARDLICGPELALFTKALHGVPAINHYCGNHDRIHAWLTAHGFPPARGAPATAQPPAPALRHAQGDWRQFLEKPETGCGKNQELDLGKTTNQFREKPDPINKSEKKEKSDDDDARAPARIDAAGKLLMEWGVENPMRQRILAHLKYRKDIVEVIRQVCESTCKQWAFGVNHEREIIKRPIGLIISRLLHDTDPQ